MGKIKPDKDRWRERALGLIEGYIWNLNNPMAGLKASDFVTTSYIKWAAEEIYYYVSDSKLEPICAIEEFRRKMSSYACKSMFTTYIFSTAENVAEDISDMLVNEYLC